MPEAGFGLTLLPGRGIARRISAQSTTWARLGVARGGGRASPRAVRRRPVGRRVRRRLRQRPVRTGRGRAARVPVRARGLTRCRAANRLLGSASPPPARWPSRAAPLPRSVVTGNPVRPRSSASTALRRAGPRPAPPSACPRTGGGGRHDGLVGFDPGQPGGGWAGRAVGGPERRGRPPRRRRAAIGRRGWAAQPCELTAAGSSTNRCGTRTAWSCCMPRPTSWCAAPAG